MQHVQKLRASLKNTSNNIRMKSVVKLAATLFNFDLCNVVVITLHTPDDDVPDVLFTMTH